MSEDAFAKLLRDRLLAEASLVASIVNHPTLVGSGRERAVIEMLRQFVPRRYEVVSGTVVANDGAPKTDRQIDVMVIDSVSIPTVLRTGEIVVAFPEAVSAVVEVKSGLTNPKTKTGSEKEGATFYDAMVQIGGIRLVVGGGRAVFAALISFGGPKGNDTVREWLVDVLEIRAMRRAVLPRAPRNAKTYLALAEEVAALSAEAMPDLIVLDTGPLALKVTNQAGEAVYEFFVPPGDTPGVVTLVEQLVIKLAAEMGGNQSQDGAPQIEVATAFKKLAKLVGVSLKKDDTCDAVTIED